MSKLRTPVTPAIRLLRQHNVVFSDHLYDYEERGGTAHSAAALGVREQALLEARQRGLDVVGADARHDRVVRVEVDGLARLSSDGSEKAPMSRSHPK